MKMLKNKNMTFEELDLFYKFCYNQIDFNKFVEFMTEVYPDKHYVIPLWDDFSKNLIGFIIGRKETHLFNRIWEEIIKTKYTG